MKITSCVPLHGQGLAGRSADLVVLTDGLGADPDPLLTVLAEVAAAGGDGSALVRGAARAALAGDDRAAWTCAGVTADGELAVFVYGDATVQITIDGGDPVVLTGGNSVLPVSQLLAGTCVTATLGLGGLVDMDARLRLDAGIVRAGGVAVTATAETMALRARSADPIAVAAATADPDEPVTVSAEVGAPAVIAAASVVAAGRTVHEPDPAVAFESVLLLPPGSDAESLDPVTHHPADATELDGRPPVLVEGVLCARNHFNDPDVQYCRVCGIGMVQLTRKVQRQRRPPLGVLVLDDGMGFTLDSDYVAGREPVLDADVAAGLARPMRITDPDGTVSRLHLRVSLVGWQVEVSDLGSANGSVLYPPAGPQMRLKPHEPVVIEPGTKVAVGRRSLEYHSYRSS
jgi:hypothetical protein